MHNVLDLRDTVPDEAEQLHHSGFDVEALLKASRIAASDDDFEGLSRILSELKLATRLVDWRYKEPSDEAGVLGCLSALKVEAVNAADIRSRIHGAWLGRCIGNTMGKPVEGLERVEVETYLRAVGQWPQKGYLPLLQSLPEGVSHLHESAPFASVGMFEDVPRDDDLDWTILGLHILETYGKDFTTEDIAREWLDRIPFTQTFTAERAAYRNLLRGVAVAEAAIVENPYREWIGALIRGDIFGYVNPGDPASAARMAFRDARLSHTENGIYGELWAAALVASAFATTHPRIALTAALACVPSGSRLAESQRQILDLHARGQSALDALSWVDSNLGHYNWVHAINNAALVAIGLLWGTDFVATVALTISGGRDTDSNAATVGSVYGALHGVDAIPAVLVGSTHVRVQSAVRGFDKIRITELAERTYRLASVPRAFADVDPAARTPVIIDTDPGLGEPGSDIDDGFAIALALRSPELEVVGLTIVNGNVDVSIGTDVARRLCERLGFPDLPVVQGASKPLQRNMDRIHQMFGAVPDGRSPSQSQSTVTTRRSANRRENASQFLVEETSKRPGQITVVAIGPMTNIAEALALDPNFATNVKEFVVMAGSATTYAQNITTVGDFNVFVDPEAMDAVLRSGAKVKMIGIDQTSQCLLNRTDADALSGTSDPFAQWAGKCTHAWIDFLHRAFPKRPEHRSGCFLHDPLIVAAVIDPAICRWEDAFVAVELESELARGLVVADRGLALEPARERNAMVATATDTARFRNLFLRRICSPSLDRTEI